MPFVRRRLHLHGAMRHDRNPLRLQLPYRSRVHGLPISAARAGGGDFKFVRASQTPNRFKNGFRYGAAANIAVATNKIFIIAMSSVDCCVPHDNSCFHYNAKSAFCLAAAAFRPQPPAVRKAGFPAVQAENKTRSHIGYGLFLGEISGIEPLTSECHSSALQLSYTPIQ